MRYWKIISLCLLILATAFACTDDDHSPAADDDATDDDDDDNTQPDDDTSDDDTGDDDDNDDDDTSDDDTDDDDIDDDDDTIDDDTGDDDVVFTPLANVASERIDGGHQYNYQWEDLALTPDNQVIAAAIRGHELIVFDRTAKGFTEQSVMQEVGQPIMAVGPDGVVHLLLLALNPYRVLYARRDGDQWTSQTLIDGYRSYETLSIAVEPDGDPVVAYTTYSETKSSFGVELAIWNGTGFDIQTVGAWERNDPVVKLAVDGEGFHHLAVLRHDHSDIFVEYLTDRSGAFVDTAVATLTDWSSRIFLAVTPTGAAAVAYPVEIDSTSRQAVVSFVENGNLTTVAVDEIAYSVTLWSLAYDAGGALHLLYFQAGDYRAAVWDGVSWAAVETAMPVAISAARFDATGALHLVGNIDTYDLYYATNTSGDWASELLDASGYVYPYAHVSAAKDTQDNLHVAYFRESDRQVLIASSSNKGWTLEEIDQLEPDDVTSPRLAVDGAGARHLLYNNGDLDLLYATDASGDWQFEVLDSFSYGNLAVDSAGAVHICHGQDNNLNYLTNRSGDWVEETLGSVFEIPYCEIVLDSADRPTISHYSFWYDIYGYYSESGLYWLEDTWQHEPFALMDWSPHYLAMYDDILHAVHQTADYDLVYKKKTAGVWSEEMLLTGGSAGLTIAADRLGRPGIAYHNEGSPDQLEYLQRDDAGWRYFIVDRLQAQRTTGTLLYTADDAAHLFTTALGALYHTSFPRPQ
ncbi:MAG TPA: hypothetical protein PK961_06140 [bacterium]|nr:hypothetical protein [bacterium]